MVARDVRVSLQGSEILHGVDIEAAPGEVVALMGGNGSGKSTFVRALVGAVPSTTGTIEFFGEPASALARARVGYVPQRLTASGGLAATALEVVMSGLLGQRTLRPGRGAHTKALKALATLGVQDLADRNVSHLSGGQQQRVLISRALVREPRMLILDEPMAGVDLESQVAFAHALGHLKEAGVAIVIVLHELGALARHIDRAVVIEHGCITYVGAPPRDLGVHALPGHDHEHPHEEPAQRTGSRLGLEGPQ
nr:ATP-binding cassette domain-containing protein [Demequina sp. TTPB684]